jgi:peptide/nickel transport system permease protein
MQRSSMLDVLNQEFVDAARARGIGERTVVYSHALRNALIPVVTIAGLQIGWLLNGSILIERVFSLPGIGDLLITAIFQRDYAVIQGVVLFIAFVFVTVNLVVDIVYALIDPRIRY